MARMEGGQIDISNMWLSDTCVDFTTRYLGSTRPMVLDGTLLVASSLFFSQLESEYKNEKKASTWYKDCLPKTRVFLAPICSDSHYSVVVVTNPFKNSKILPYDPLGQAHSSQYIQEFLSQYLLAYSESKIKLVPLLKILAQFKQNLFKLRSVCP